MKQAKLIGPKQFVIIERDIPGIGEDELLVKVDYCGICGSDLHAYHGKNQFVRYPYVPGHEFVGQIVEVGKSAKRFRKGQIVTVEPGVQCGQCMYCLRGDYQLCINPRSGDGAFAEYTVIKEKKAYEVPAGLAREKGTLIEPVACALHAADQAGEIEGQNVLIFGAGTIGQLISQTVRLLAAKRIIIADLVRKKLDMAKRFGADQTLKVTEDTTPEDVQKQIPRHEVDLVFDCVSNSFSMNSAIAVLKRSGKIVVVGVPSNNVCFDLGLVMFNELRISGCLMYRNNFPKAVELIEEGKVNLDGFISRTFSLNEIQKAFDEVIENKANYVKCLVQP